MNDLPMIKHRPSGGRDLFFFFYNDLDGGLFFYLGFGQFVKKASSERRKSQSAHIQVPFTFATGKNDFSV